jgi:hypothetical protein
MGTFSKKMRKRTMREQFAKSKMMNNYLMQRVSTLMDQVAELTPKTTEDTPSVETTG